MEPLEHGSFPHDLLSGRHFHATSCSGIVLVTAEPRIERKLVVSSVASSASSSPGIAVSRRSCMYANFFSVAEVAVSEVDCLFITLARHNSSVRVFLRSSLIHIHDRDWGAQCPNGFTTSYKHTSGGQLPGLIYPFNFPFSIPSGSRAFVRLPMIRATAGQCP